MPRPDQYPEYQAVIATPVGPIGLAADGDVLVRLDFLPESLPLRPTQSAILREVERQLHAWFADPDVVFDIPWRADGSPHQQRVWQAIYAIGVGKTRTYAEIAHEVGSVARAVGGACGMNPIPIIIPCHRVVAANGLGGFNANRNGRDWLPIKRWLLTHEMQDLFAGESRGA
ncbi:methylated-DNA--[protein]-cysteine S-methyltransferase [Amantichitinum ursilacus]|uniref:Methylated-DNA--protein-cysteine methyltransferase n=1 Tax=Amantichitinum ursilacus TaxID=857265 RepID=A0A0N1JRI4_9NEIS|nr:methylated-DNA--[protein]-cysteine S-methyltransferase [Amantichitinum ursilacus]KPC49217.1 Methylated-DNA--protein-cysteine methyltransferase [Amantichitinum ursilacus]